MNLARAQSQPAERIILFRLHSNTVNFRIVIQFTPRAYSKLLFNWQLNRVPTLDSRRNFDCAFNGNNQIRQIEFRAAAARTRSPGRAPVRLGRPARANNRREVITAKTRASKPRTFVSSGYVSHLLRGRIKATGFFRLRRGNSLSGGSILREPASRPPGERALVFLRGLLTAEHFRGASPRVS